MFYFEKIDEKQVLKSDLIKNMEAFFTTRDICICCKDIDTAKKDISIEQNKKAICKYLDIMQKSSLYQHVSRVEKPVENVDNYVNNNYQIILW